MILVRVRIRIKRLLYFESYFPSRQRSSQMQCGKRKWQDGMAIGDMYVPHYYVKSTAAWLRGLVWMDGTDKEETEKSELISK